MAWKRISWRACKGSARLCITLLHAMLGLVAFFLVGIIASIHLIGTVQVPRFMAKLLREQFAQQGIQVGWQSAQLDLKGQLLLEGFQCLEQATGNPILRAEFVLIDLDLSGSLRRPLFSPEFLFVRNAQCFIPPELAADGGAEATLTVVEMSVRFSPDTLNLTSIFLRSGNVHLAARGPVPFKNRHPEAEETSSDQQASIAWRRFAALVVQPLERLHHLPALWADIAFELAEGDHWLGSVTLTIPQIERYGVIGERVLIQFPEIDLLEKAINRPTTASIERLRRATHPMPELLSTDLFLRGPPRVDESGWRLPSTVWAYGRLDQIDLPGTALSVLLPLDPLPENLDVTACLSLGSARLEADLHIALSNQKGTLQLTWEGDPDPLLKSPRVAGGALGEQARFSHFTHLESTIDLGPGGQWSRGLFRLKAFKSGVREADFDEVGASGWFTHEHLQVGPIFTFDPDGQHAEGYYLQDLQTNDYRIVAEGRVYPHRLDSLLPSFYRDLWVDIDPGQDPVAGDVDVISRWGAPELSHSLVYARGEALGYLGIPIETLELHLWQATGFVDLMTLNLQSADGPLKGSVGITFPPAAAPETPRLRLLNLNTAVPLADLAAVFGNDVKRVEEDVVFSRAPEINIQGLVTLLPDKSARKDLFVDVHADAPWTLRGIEFDRLLAKLHLEGSTIHLDPFVASAGDGRWELIGTFSDPTAESQKIRLETAMRHVPYSTFRQILQLADRGEKEKEEEEEKAGWVDLTLSLHCDGDPWATMGGEGTIHIQEANFGRVNLFGGLSRAFSSVGLNLASFQLDQLSSTLQLKPNRLELPDLVVRGPSLRLDTPGSLGLPSTTLDFRSKVFFLNTENPTLRGLFGEFLRPFAHVFELRVGGTLEEPTWNLVNSPLNLFRSTKPENENPPPKTAPESAIKEVSGDPAPAEG